MSSSNCCFLTCMQISQEASKVVWYSHLFQNFPQFVVIHTVKDFGVVNKAEIDVFLKLSCFVLFFFLIIQWMLAIWSLVPLPSLIKNLKKGFLCASAGKKSICNVGDLDSIPGLGRSPGEGNSYPLQYPGLENSMDCIVHGVSKSQTRLWASLTSIGIITSLKKNLSLSVKHL